MQAATTVSLEAPSALRPLLEKHLGFIGEQAGEGLDEGGRVALLRRARKEIASLLATEGYFTPSVEGRDAADDDRPEPTGTLVDSSTLAPERRLPARSSMTATPKT